MGGVGVSGASVCMCVSEDHGRVGWGQKSAVERKPRGGQLSFMHHPLPNYLRVAPPGWS